MTAAQAAAMLPTAHRPVLSVCAAAVLALSGCGERPPAAASAPAAPTAASAGGAPSAPAAAAESAPPARPGAMSAAVSDRFAAEEAGWRVAFRLELPPLPEASARRIRRACEAWLFQGLVAPRATFAESAAEAHRLLIADTPHVGAADTWYAERAVIATRLGGGWLALSRSDSSFAGGAHANTKLEGLVVQVDEVRALTLDEVVAPERQPALRRLLAGELRTLRKLPADGPLTSEIATDDDLPIPLPVIGDAGARFVWNPYEIAPYSEGAFEVSLPAAQVGAFLARNPW